MAGFGFILVLSYSVFTPSFVSATNLMPIPSFKTASRMAMCSRPEPETRFNPTSKSFVFPFRA